MLRPCLEVGCPEKVRSGRCPAHARAHTAARRTRRQARGVQQIYDHPRWRATRQRALARAGHQCQALAHGDRCPARGGLNGHHDYPGGLEQMLADGADPFDERYVVMLCRPHHGQVEAWLRARNGSKRR